MHKRIIEITKRITERSKASRRAYLNEVDKMFEEGVEINGEMFYKGSEPHKATVVGDTVGDPFKDTSGPSLNILLKLMSVVALVIAPSIALDKVMKDNEAPVETKMEVMQDETGSIEENGAALFSEELIE